MRTRLPTNPFEFDESSPRGMTRTLLVAMALSSAVATSFLYLLWRLL
jgi:hypothetical protein